MPSAKCQFCALNTFRENVWTNKQTNKQGKNNIVTGGTGDYNKRGTGESRVDETISQTNHEIIYLSHSYSFTECVLIFLHFISNYINEVFLFIIKQNTDVFITHVCLSVHFLMFSNVF